MREAVTFRNMTVGSGVITGAEQYRLFVSLKAKPAFRYMDVTLAMSKLEIQHSTIERGSDRFLQRLRRMGLLEFNRNHSGRWSWAAAPGGSGQNLADANQNPTPNPNRSE